MNNTQHVQIRKMTLTAFLAALIVVLQLISYFIKFGPFNLSFVLIPIVIGGIIAGPTSGVFLGFIFGVVVTIVSVLGMDQGGNILFNANPLFCIILCVGKGWLAGYFPAVIYRFLHKRINNNIVSVALSSAAAPICNTGFFCVGMLIMYKDILVSWAGGTNVLLYIITGLVGINFIIEFLINIILCPIITASVLKVNK